MATRGFLIRFIDIGLIVLFGFLLISDIEASSRVELSGGSAEVLDEPTPEEERAAVLVRIAADGSLFLTELSDGPDAPSVPVPGGASADALSALAQGLEAARDAHRSRELSTLVLIEPHPASIVQRTVDVMDLCDRIGLAKSLRMDIEIEGASGGGGQP